MPDSYTQADRPIFSHFVGLEDDDLMLEGFQGIEQISTPFQFNLRLLSTKTDVDLDALVRKPVTIGVRSNDDAETFRYINGRVKAARLLSRDPNLVRYEVEMVPWLWYLTLYSDCRIYQNKSVVDIVTDVFNRRGFTDFTFATTGTYTAREYCVQYRESDFNFISRLLEEEGIYYYFEHLENKHTLMLIDATSAIKPCPVVPKLRYEQGSTFQEPDVVTALTFNYSARTEVISLTDYDFENPSSNLMSTTSADHPEEVYDYPGDYFKKDLGDRYVKIRLEEQEVYRNTAHGQSVCPFLTSGYKFELKEHFKASVNQNYTLISVQHTASAGDFRSSVSEFNYNNVFTVLPFATPYRPPRIAKKPVVQGTQTAVVSGPSGEEIHCDKYGRIKVHFFWDRQGKKDGADTCWIRVSQAWAGKGWGWITIPRIGQEVIVDFLEGDPDRPIVTGRVYNATQVVPYTLPDESTKSAFKSMSSKGGGGFNEIRFEDKKGSEQVFMHAEKDMEIRVKNDRKEIIKRDDHLIIERDRKEKVTQDVHVAAGRHQYTKIGGESHLKIGDKQAIDVGANYSLKVGGNAGESIGGNYSLKASGTMYFNSMGALVIESTAGITLKCGGASVVLTPMDVSITGAPKVNLNSGGSPGTGSAVALVSPTAPGDPLEADNANPGQTTSDSGSGSSKTDSYTGGGKGLASRASGPPASGAPAHDPNSEENKDKKHWVQIQLVDEAGQPVPGEYFVIKLADGSTVEGTTDDQGMSARVEALDPGSVDITFPNLDQEAWEPL